jgi:hypothetical protein
MWEWHAWAKIVGSPSADDDEAAEIRHRAAVESVRLLVANAQGYGNEVCDLRGANGTWHLWFAGDHNHASSWPLDFFASVAQAAPGSYGVMYMFDHNFMDEPWKRFVMKRGRLHERIDHDLSPHIGMVEDPWVDPD